MKKSRLSHIGLIFVVLLCPGFAACMNSVTETQSADPTQSDVLAATDTPTTPPSPTALPSPTPTSTPTTTEQVFDLDDCIGNAVVVKIESRYLGICIENGKAIELERNTEWIKSTRWWVTEEELMQYLDPAQVLMRLADSKSVPVGNSEWRFEQATKSPDGRYIAYSFLVRLDDYYYGIEIIDTQTSNISTGIYPISPAPMLTIIEIHERMVWAPVGNQIMLFSRALPLTILQVDCNHQTGYCTGETFIPAPAKQPADTAWAPDGTAIAYVCYDGYDFPPSEQTKHLCIQETTNEIRLIEAYPEEIGLHEIDETGWVRWSPDGARLAFNAWESENGKKDVIIFSIADQTVTNLTENFDGDYAVIAWLK